MKNNTLSRRDSRRRRASLRLKTRALALCAALLTAVSAGIVAVPSSAATATDSIAACNVRWYAGGYFGNTAISDTVASGQSPKRLELMYFGTPVSTYGSAYVTNVITKRGGAADEVITNGAVTFAYTGSDGTYGAPATFRAWDASYLAQTITWSTKNDDGTKGSSLCSATVNYQGQPTITVTPSGSGTASASPTTVAVGGSTTLSAVPDTGYAVTWSCTGGSLSSTTGSPVTLSSITGDATCAATFSLARSITLSAVNGTASASPSAVVSGGSTTLSAVANSGYVFSSWSCSGGSLSSTMLSYATLSNITADVTCTATFAISGKNYGHSDKITDPSRDRKNFSSTPKR